MDAGTGRVGELEEASRGFGLGHGRTASRVVHRDGLSLGQNACGGPIDDILILLVCGDGKAGFSDQAKGLQELAVRHSRESVVVHVDGGRLETGGSGFGECRDFS